VWGADGQRGNKKSNGRLLLGKEWNGFPSIVIDSVTPEPTTN
jgi:hypothetical protein